MEMISYLILKDNLPYKTIKVQSNAIIDSDWCHAIGGDSYEKLV